LTTAYANLCTLGDEGHHASRYAAAVIDIYLGGYRKGVAITKLAEILRISNLSLVKAWRKQFVDMLCCARRRVGVIPPFRVGSRFPRVCRNHQLSAHRSTLVPRMELDPLVEGVFCDGCISAYEVDIIHDFVYGIRGVSFH
jgi:hypothetical protein